MKNIWKLFVTCLFVMLISCLFINIWLYLKQDVSDIQVHKIQCKRPRTEKGYTYDLRIIVIVYDRYWSLLRLLNSLNNAEYGTDKVKLEVWIDRSTDGTVNQRTLHTAKNFTFCHGFYDVNVHQRHVGIFGQWVSTWIPHENSSEIAVILEDDLTVSPYFYKYLKLVHNEYDAREKINGYALQGGSVKHHMNDNSPLAGPKKEIVFLYPVIGTWGFSPNPKNWIKFTDWCSKARKNASFQPYVPENIATNWFKKLEKEGRADTMWEIWHIYHAWKHAEFTLYPNLKALTGLATNWQEKGLHFSGKGRGPSNKLLLEWKSSYERLPTFPVHLDLKGKVIQTEH